MKPTSMKIAAAFMAVMSLAACQNRGTDQPSQTPPPLETQRPSPTNTATALPALVEPAEPQAGRSNVYGRVVWQGQPVPDVTLELEGVGYERADGVVAERVVTDEAGMFVFRDIPEGYFYTLNANLEAASRPPS